MVKCPSHKILKKPKKVSRKRTSRKLGIKYNTPHDAQGNDSKKSNTVTTKQYNQMFGRAPYD